MGIFDGIVGAVSGFFTGGPVGGIIGAIGGLAAGEQAAEGAENANAANWHMQKDQQAFNSAEAATNRDWQERMITQNQAFQTQMSNTQWQRGVADMKSAGLNPMLAYSQGGASSPQGNVTGGSQATSGIGNPMQNTKLAGIQAAMQFAGTAANIKLLDEQAKKVQAEQENVRMDTWLKERMGHRTDAERIRFGSLNEKDQQEVRKLEREIAWIERQMKEDMPEAQAKKLWSERQKLVGELQLIIHQEKYADTYYRERAREMTSSATLRGLEIPLASNLARAQDSWWMREVSPYLGDAGRVGSAAAGAARFRAPTYHRNTTIHNTIRNPR